MALAIAASGTPIAADLKAIHVDRLDDGTLVGIVHFKVNVLGEIVTRTAAWNLSSSDKTAIAGLVPNALAAIRSNLGL